MEPTHLVRHGKNITMIFFRISKEATKIYNYKLYESQYQELIGYMFS